MTAETKDRENRVLQALSSFEEPRRPTDIGAVAGETPLNTGTALTQLGKGGFAQKVDEEKNLWLITAGGKEHLSSLPSAPQGDKGPIQATEPAAEPKVAEPEITIPSQADLFRGIGERLGVGTKKGDIKLDAITYYVQRTANLDKLDSIWNALTEMGVASDVRKRWVKLYAQNLPSKEIPESLKEKLESGDEAEKVAEEGKREVQPKPKRFTLIGNDIIGDPEGDLTFKEALQQRAQNLGAKPEQASQAATIIEAMKVGPEMSTSLLTVLLPLLTKEPPKQDNTAITMLQQRIEQLADEKHKAEMEVLRTEIKAGQGPSGPNPEIQALTQQINEMREALHNEQLVRIQEQNKAVTQQLVSRLERLDEQVRAAQEAKTADSKIGLMSDVMHEGFGELRGLREDLRPVVQGLASPGGERPPAKRRDKAGFSEGLDKGIDKERKLRVMEDKLFLGKE